MLCFEPLNWILGIYSQANTSQIRGQGERYLTKGIVYQGTHKKKSLNKILTIEERQNIATSGNILQPFF